MTPNLDRMRASLRLAAEADTIEETLLPLAQALSSLDLTLHVLAPDMTPVAVETPEMMVAGQNLGIGPGAQLIVTDVPGGHVSTLFVGIGSGPLFETALIRPELPIMMARQPTWVLAQEFHAAVVAAVTAGTKMPDDLREDL